MDLESKLLVNLPLRGRHLHSAMTPQGHSSGSVAVKEILGEKMT